MRCVAYRILGDGEEWASRGNGVHREEPVWHRKSAGGCLRGPHIPAPHLWEIARSPEYIHHGNPGFLVRRCNSLPSRAIRKLEIIMIDMVNVLYSISGLGSAVHMHMAVSDVTHHPAHRMCPWCACHIKDGKLRNLLPCLVLWATSIGPSLASHVTQGLPCCHGVSNGSLMASHENSCIARFASQGVPRR